MKFLRFLNIALLFLGLNPAFAESPLLCPSPRLGSVPLSFSIPNFSPGEFDRVCATRIQRGAEDGFTSVTSSPKVGFDRKSNRSLIGLTLVEGELTRCLETAWKAGLDIVYSPHVEDETAGEATLWRAKFDLKPDSYYEAAGYEEFLKWVEKNSTEISKSAQKVRVSLETELETSTLNHTSEWIDFTQAIRRRLAKVGLDNKIPLGIQPNWYPLGDPSFWDCSKFRKWIGSLDFVSPSMYGDWSKSDLGISQMPKRNEETLSALTRESRRWCKVPEFNSKPFGYGEIGFGSDPVHSERWDPVPADRLSGFLKTRESIYANMISWMKSQTDLSFGSPVINIWAYGIFDPIGIDSSSLVVADDVILQSFKDYKNWRCLNSK